MAYTQFYRIKGGSGVTPPPPPPTITFDKVDEIEKIFMNSALGQAWNMIHKIFKCHQLFQKLLVMGEGDSTSAFYSVKLCVKINVKSIIL